MAEAGWQIDGRAFRWVLLVLPVACAVLPAIMATKLLRNTESLYPDFFALWSFGRFALGHVPAAIYDDGALHAFEAGFGLPPDAFYPFPYPPWVLLVLVPFGALPYSFARIGWLLVTVAGYVWAVAAWRWPRPLQALLLLAPASVLCCVVGQNGFLSAALMLGGVRLLQRRPWASGMLFGALAYKPQLAILVPFALLFGRHWRVMLAAAATMCALSAATSFALGSAIWGGWLATMRDQAAALTAGREAMRDMMPTVTSSVLLLGGDASLAHVAQAVSAVACLWALWRVRARHDAAAQAVLPLATVLATPYAFGYDLPLTTGAILTVLAARIAAAGHLGGVEFPLLLACVVSPTVLAAHHGMVQAVVPGVFAVTLWLLATDTSQRAVAMPS